MPVLSGNEIRIKVSGSGIPFISESTETTDNRTYSIVDKGKEIWDMNTPVTVEVNGVATTEPYIVDHVNGTVIFPTVDYSRVVTVNGSYVTTSTAGIAYKISYTETCNLYDITGFEDTYRKRLKGIMESSGEIGDWDVVHSYYREALLQGKPILIEINEYEGGVPKRIWAILESREIASAVDSAQEATVSFQSTGKFS